MQALLPEPLPAALPEPPPAASAPRVVERTPPLQPVQPPPLPDLRMLEAYRLDAKPGEEGPAADAPPAAVSAASASPQWGRPLSGGELAQLLASPIRPSTPSHAPPPYPVRPPQIPTPPNAASPNDSPLHIGAPPSPSHATGTAHPFAMLRSPTLPPLRGPSPKPAAGEQRAMAEWAHATARHPSPYWRAPSPSPRLGDASPHGIPPSGFSIPPLPMTRQISAEDASLTSPRLPGYAWAMAASSPAYIERPATDPRSSPCWSGPSSATSSYVGIPQGYLRPSTDPRSSPRLPTPGGSAGGTSFGVTTAMLRPSTDPRRSPRFSAASSASGLMPPPLTPSEQSALLRRSPRLAHGLPSGSPSLANPPQASPRLQSGGGMGVMLPPPPRSKKPPPADSTLTDEDIQQVPSTAARSPHPRLHPYRNHIRTSTSAILAPIPTSTPTHTPALTCLSLHTHTATPPYTCAHNRAATTAGQTTDRPCLYADSFSSHTRLLRMTTWMN